LTIFGTLSTAFGVLRIDPSTDPIVTLHGNFPDGGHKWHGAVLAPNGSIIGIPANGEIHQCFTYFQIISLTDVLMYPVLK
jgi:hypothetical protein